MQTTMQTAAIDLDRLPRALAARLLGLRSPQAVSNRLRRAAARSGGGPGNRTPRPRTVAASAAGFNIDLGTFAAPAR